MRNSTTCVFVTVIFGVNTHCNQSSVVANCLDAHTTHLQSFTQMDQVMCAYNMNRDKMTPHSVCHKSPTRSEDICSRPEIKC